MNLTELKKRPISDLVKLAGDHGSRGKWAVRASRTSSFGVLKAHARKGEDIYGDGVLEILQDGFGFLRSSDSSYLAGPDDIYVSPSQIRRFNLRTGDSISGLIRPPKDGGAILRAAQSGRDQLAIVPMSSRGKVLFENLTPLHPTERLKLERGQWLDRRLDRPRHRPGGADRQGTARSHRLAAQGRQDHAAGKTSPPPSQPTILRFI